jgi:predicted ArsR family transcriptional regulator
MTAATITGAKHRLLERLKREGALTANELARSLRLTDVAIRQHLAVLEGEGIVSQHPEQPSGRGRPSVRWSLTTRAREFFPDRHAELTAGIIQAAREAFGQKGLEKLVKIRVRDQLASYTEELAAAGSTLRKRVEALARRRTAEGYMAEIVNDGRNGFLLIEHNCPICEAAQACTGLCDGELEMFQQTLGEGVHVERTEHLIAGGDRCVYRIKPAA